MRNCLSCLLLLLILGLSSLAVTLYVGVPVLIDLIQQTQSQIGS